MFQTPDEVTKYELCRIIGLRSLQISEDAAVRYDNNPHDLAVEELKAGTLEFSIRRYLPNNSYEDRHVSTLKIPQQYLMDAYRIMGSGQHKNKCII